MTLTLTATGRGFLRGEFTDRYGSACSIQESSSAEVDSLWLGVDDHRMHLSREHAAALLPLLSHFVEHGVLSLPTTERTA